MSSENGRAALAGPQAQPPLQREQARTIFQKGAPGRRAFADRSQFARLAGEILVPEPPPKIRVPRHSRIDMPRSQSKAAESVGIGAGLVHPHT